MKGWVKGNGRVGKDGERGMEEEEDGGRGKTIIAWCICMVVLGDLLRGRERDGVVL